MIKFFRKIRQNLLMENKTGKYFKYAIGEIILVVIGILIALAINNWNTNRINTSKQRGYLLAIKNDLEKQIPELNKLVNRCDSISAVGSNILNDYKSNQDFLLIDNLDKKLSILFYAEKFPEISTTFDELKSTGQINLIRSKPVRAKIISYYQNAKNAQEGIRTVTKDIVYSHVYPTFQSSTAILSGNFGLKNGINEVPSKIQSVLNAKFTDSDSELKLFNTINLRIISAMANQKILLESKDEAEQLFDIIVKELK
jgi:hypothetical protein